MLWLDCSNPEATLASLVKATRVGETELVSALREYDEACFKDLAKDPCKRMPREILDRVGVSFQDLVRAFEGIFYRVPRRFSLRPAGGLVLGRRGPGIDEHPG